MENGCARRRWTPSSRAITIISPQQRAAAEEDGARSLPRVVLVPGKGLFGLGASAKDAAIAADIAENTIEVITDAEAIGTYRCISEADMFEVEYWSLEQAKLGKAAEKPLARQVASSPAAARASARRPRRRWRRPARKWPCSIATAHAAPGRARDRQDGARHRLRRDRSRKACARRSTRSPSVRRRRHRRLECRRRLAGHHRHRRRRNPAPILRAQFLRPSERWRSTPCAS
jgi:hypothetical protein